jgi:hypothetical protein
MRSPNHGAMRGAQLAHGVADLLSIQSRFETFVVSRCFRHGTTNPYLSYIGLPCIRTYSAIDVSAV